MFERVAEALNQRHRAVGGCLVGKPGPHDRTHGNDALDNARQPALDRRTPGQQEIHKAVGATRTAVLDDLESNDELKICKKDAEVNTDRDMFVEHAGLGMGDITLPPAQGSESFRTVCASILFCVSEWMTSASDRPDGHRAVKILESAGESREHSGVHVSTGGLQ